MCLNVGCIPTKALLHAAEVKAEAKHASDFGLNFNEAKLDVAKLNEWKEGIVKRLTGGVSSLLKGNKVTIFNGQASFVDDHTIEVGGEKHTAANFIIATGSEPARLPAVVGATPTVGGKSHPAPTFIFPPGSEPARLPTVAVDQEVIVDSTGALVMPDPVPARMLCIGGGVIGFEFAQVYNNLGSEVKIIEFMPNVIPGADADAVKEFTKIMTKQGITIETQTKANKAERKDDGLHVEIENVQTGEKRTEVFDRVLVAIGRRPRTDGLNAEKAGVTVNERGFIPADKQQRTNVPHIYAIGDVAGNPMLAHKAMKEGLVAAGVIAGKPEEQDAAAIPGVVYTNPELAWVGLTEAEAKEKGYKVKKGVFPMSASGRAMTLQQTDGFIKMVVDEDTDLVLGVHIVGPRASDLLGEAGLAIEMAATASDIALTIHAHPTLGEGVLEAAEAVHKQAIHIINLSLIHI